MLKESILFLKYNVEAKKHMKPITISVDHAKSHKFDSKVLEKITKLNVLVRTNIVILNIR